MFSDMRQAFLNPECEISNYILNVLYLLNFVLPQLYVLYDQIAHASLKATKVTAADCKPVGGPPTQPWTQDPEPMTIDPRP